VEAHCRPAVESLVDAKRPLLDGRGLIAEVEAHARFQASLREFLPGAHRSAGEAERWRLFLHHVWRLAEKARRPPAIAVHAAVVSDVLRRGAARELPERLSRNIGADAAVAFLLAAWPSIWPQTADCPTQQEAYGALTDRFVRSVRKNVRGNLRERASTDDLRGQAMVTIWRRFGRRQHPLDLMARALDGGAIGLNHAPRAIGNDVSRLVGREGPHAGDDEHLVILLRDPSVRGFTPQAVPDVLYELLDEESEAARRNLDPALYDAVTRTAVKKDIAKALGVSRPTVYKRIARAVKKQTR
jgi:DNA-directed RNA polymerase specialized sigma24 family protein